jgi:signal transduction histidine kinase
MDDLNSSNFLNTATLKSSFKASDREQAQIRLVIPMLALLWAARNPVGSGAFCFWGFEPHFAMAGLYFLVGVAIFFIWRSVYKHLPQHAGLLRKICLFSDISAISAYSAVSDSASIVLLPIYLSAIIGYGMRFGKRYLVAALLLGLTQFLFVIHLNPYLSMNSPIVTTYVISMAFVPIYTLILLQKYSLVFAAYISTSRDLEHFIDVMSHEIRAPLQSIISLGELCQARLRKLLPISPLIPSLHMNMLDISRCAERMLAVANRITAQRKLANATQRSQQAYFNTFRDIFLAIRVCTVIAARKRLQFQWYVDPNTPCLTNIDSSSLQAVLINLRNF